MKCECGGEEFVRNSGFIVCKNCGLTMDRAKLSKSYENQLSERDKPKIKKEFHTTKQIDLLEEDDKIITKIVSMKKYSRDIRYSAAFLLKRMKKYRYFLNIEKKLRGVLSLFVILKKNEIPFSLYDLFKMFGKKYSKRVVFKNLEIMKGLDLYKHKFQNSLFYLQKTLNSEWFNFTNRRQVEIFKKLSILYKTLNTRVKYSCSQLNLLGGLMEIFINDATSYEVRMAIKDKWNCDIGTNKKCVNVICNFFLSFRRLKEIVEE